MTNNFRTIGCCICKHVFQPEELADEDKMGFSAKAMQKGISALCKRFRIVPDKNLLEVYTTFCPSCIRVLKDIVQIQEKIELLAGQIQEKVTILGRTLLKSANKARKSDSPPDDGAKHGKRVKMGPRMKPLSIRIRDEFRERALSSLDASAMPSHNIWPDVTPSKCVTLRKTVTQNVTRMTRVNYQGTEMMVIDQEDENRESSSDESSDESDVISDAGDNSSCSSGDDSVVEVGGTFQDDDDSKTVILEVDPSSVRVRTMSEATIQRLSEEAMYENEELYEKVDLATLGVTKEKLMELEPHCDEIQSGLVCNFCGEWVLLNKFATREEAVLTIAVHIYKSHVKGSSFDFSKTDVVEVELPTVVV